MEQAGRSVRLPCDVLNGAQAVRQVFEIEVDLVMDSFNDKLAAEDGDAEFLE